MDQPVIAQANQPRFETPHAVDKGCGFRRRASRNSGPMRRLHRDINQNFRLARIHGIYLYRSLVIRAPRVEKHPRLCVRNHSCVHCKRTLFTKQELCDTLLNADMDDVGKRIREVRKSRGMTQDQLATATGLSKSFISEVENDSRNASSKNLLNIADALGASLEYLLRGVSPSDKQSEKTVNVPPQLAVAAERLGLTFSEMLDLLQTQRSVVARRGFDTPKELSAENWMDLHKTIKKVFG